MASHRDVLLFFSLGLFGYCAARAAHQQLLAVRKAVEITKVEEPPAVISQATEDAIKPETLRTLADGANYDIRVPAIKIIAERSKREATYELVLEDVAGKDNGRRDRALVCLNFLMSREITAPSQLNSYRSCKAVIDCLRTFSLELGHSLEELSPDLYAQRRSLPERHALAILENMLRFGMDNALRAGIVNRWLSHYFFRRVSGSNSSRQDAFRQALKPESHYEDPHMQSICVSIYQDPRGRKELRNHGLVGSSIQEFGFDDGDDTWMSGGDDTAGFRREINLLSLGRRPREESMEERVLRRRRREAMVLNDGGEPLSGHDIFPGTLGFFSPVTDAQ